MMIKGKTFDTENAFKHDLFHEVFGDVQERETNKGKMRTVRTLGRAVFLEEVLVFTQKQCSLHRASTAVGHRKRGVQGGLHLPLESGLILERELQVKFFASAETA